MFVSGRELKEVLMDNGTATDKLVNDLKTLIGDAEELLKATANQAGEKVAVARQKIEQSLIEGKKPLADSSNRPPWLHFPEGFTPKGGSSPP